MLLFYLCLYLFAHLMICFSAETKAKEKYDSTTEDFGVIKTGRKVCSSLKALAAQCQEDKTTSEYCILLILLKKSKKVIFCLL